MDGKWKTSQNRPMADRAGVVQGLEAEGKTTSALEMARLVRSRGGLDEE
jgi:transcriptional regulator